MAHYLMMAQRGIEELYQDTDIINDDLLVEIKIRDISNYIRNMVIRRRGAYRVQNQQVEEEEEYSSVAAEVRPTVGQLRPCRKPIIKVKLVSLFALNTPCKSQCSICHETHVKVDSLTTDCNHEFGKECYNEWVSKQNSCPMCRNVCKNVTVYKGDTK